MSFEISAIDSKEKENKVRSFVGYGINKNTMIIGVEGYTPEGKSPYVEFTVGVSLNDPNNTTKLKLYMSPKAEKVALIKISHLANILDVRDAVNAAGESSNSVIEFATKLNTIFKGKKVTNFKLCAEEYINANGETKAKPFIGFPPFADMSEVTKLTFDKANLYDYVPVQQATSGTVLDATAEKANDMPF